MGARGDTSGSDGSMVSALTEDWALLVRASLSSRSRSCAAANCARSCSTSDNSPSVGASRLTPPCASARRRAFSCSSSATRLEQIVIFDQHLVIGNTNQRGDAGRRVVKSRVLHVFSCKACRYSLAAKSRQKSNKPTRREGSTTTRHASRRLPRHRFSYSRARQKQAEDGEWTSKRSKWM